MKRKPPPHAQMLTQWVAAAPLKAALALLAVLVAARTGVFIHSIRAYREKTKADRCLAPRTFLSLPAGSAPVRRLEFFKINDEVMGGRSTSSVTAKGGDVTFSGVINTNGGGFASFRTLGARSAGSDDEAPLGLPAECATVEVAATGDGRAYIKFGGSEFSNDFALSCAKALTDMWAIEGLFPAAHIAAAHDCAEGLRLLRRAHGS